jgi:hypothetical protein
MRNATEQPDRDDSATDPDRSGAGSSSTTRREALGAAAGVAIGAIAAPAFARQSIAQAGDEQAPDGDGGPPAELVVLWTSADPDVAHRVGLMYTHAAKTQRWFERVRLVVWGPSQRTLVGDKDLKAKVRSMQDDGVRLQACIACANSFGIASDLEAIGFEVLPMGEPLTAFLKDATKAVLTV